MTLNDGVGQTSSSINMFFFYRHHFVHLSSLYRSRDVVAPAFVATGSLNVNSGSAGLEPRLLRSIRFLSSSVYVLRYM